MESANSVYTTVTSSLPASFDAETEVSIAFNEKRALESFLADVDIPDELQHDHVHSELSLPPTKSNTQPWRRRKVELHTLRAQVQEMQKQLTHLKLQSRRLKLVDARRDISAKQKRWKVEAVNEKKRCQKAKNENAKLKEKVEKYQHMSKTLQIILTVADPKASEQFVCTAFAERALRTELKTGHHLNLLSPVVFGMLENAMLARCNELESILQESQMPMPRADTDQVEINPKNDIMEFKRTHVLPYTVEQVGNALWSMIKMGAIPDERSAQVTMKPDGAVAIEGCFTIPLENGGTVNVRAYCLMKRVTTSQGCLVLLETTTEWSASEQWRHVTRDSGWLAVYPLDPDGSTPNVSQVRTLTRLQPTSTEMTHASPMNEEITACFRKMTRTRHQLLDNKLLDTFS